MNITLETNNLIQFSDWYRNIHGWLSTIVCIFGIPCNLLNILVLTRPNMISSPTNLILTALAFSDLFTMMSSLPNSVYFYLIHDPNKIESHERDSFFWISYQMMHVAVSVTTHCISIWLTVYLAFFRYIFLLTATPPNTNSNHNLSSNVNLNMNSKSNLKTQNKTQLLISLRNRFLNSIQNFLKKCRTYNFTVISIISIAVFCVLFCVPSYLYPAIREKDYFDSLSNLTHKIYHINRSNLEIASDGKVYQIMFYSQAIFAKFIPCFLLVTFTSLLISSLIVINKNNKKLSTTYGARANLISQEKLTLKSRARKQFKKYFSFSKDETNHLMKMPDTNKQSVQSSKIINGHKNNHFLSYKNGFIKIWRKSSEEQPNDLNKKYLNDDELKKDEFTYTNESNSNINKESKSPTSLNSLRVNNLNGGKVNKKVQKVTKSTKAKENLRTTLMLVIVCVLFLITEFPQSILLFLSIVIKDFYNEVYMPLGDIMDIFALINNSINFVLYCIMSRAFRNTFYSIVSPFCCCISKLIDTTESNQTQTTLKSKYCNETPVVNNQKRLNIKETLAASNAIYNSKPNLELKIENNNISINNRNFKPERLSSHSSFELKPMIS